MVRKTPPTTESLYTLDETAWLESTAELIRTGRLGEVEHDILAEHLNDMARRDYREVYTRLVVLLCHLLKWEFQPDHRTRSWHGTILEQQRELRLLLESKSLRNHAESRYGDAYEDARKQAAAETGLARATFPAECPWPLDEALADRDEDTELRSKV